MPWFDDQEKLNEYGKMNSINSNFWYLLTGPKHDIYKIARESYLQTESLENQ